MNAMPVTSQSVQNQSNSEQQEEGTLALLTLIISLTVLASDSDEEIEVSQQDSSPQVTRVRYSAAQTQQFHEEQRRNILRSLQTEKVDPSNKPNLEEVCI